MESTVDTSDKLKATVQALLQNKDIISYGQIPNYFTPVWQEVKGISVFGRDEWKRLNQIPISSLFEDSLLPNILQINDIFRSHLDEVITNASLRAMAYRLLNFASEKSLAIIPIKYHRSIVKSINQHAIILFNTESNVALTKLGISPNEQSLFFLAHELGHCFLHHHYNTNIKTKEKQTKEYILFNERMAWHVASDLLYTHCQGFDINQFSKQWESCITQYDEYYSAPENLNQLFTEI